MAFRKAFSLLVATGALLAPISIQAPTGGGELALALASIVKVNSACAEESGTCIPSDDVYCLVFVDGTSFYIPDYRWSTAPGPCPSCHDPPPQ
jgi:hypothetical protein